MAGITLATRSHHTRTTQTRTQRAARKREREREKERESTRARAREYNSRPTPWQLFSLCVRARARGRQTERRRERDRQRDLAKRQPLTGTAVDLENVDLTPRALRPHHPFAVLWLCVCGLESHVYKSLRLAQYASRFVVYDTLRTDSIAARQPLPKNRPDCVCVRACARARARLRGRADGFAPCWLML